MGIKINNITFGVFRTSLLMMFLFSGFTSGAIPGFPKNRIDRAFEALKAYNYFEARGLFIKSNKRFPCTAYYGLSVIYERNDNPFHNYDSAYFNILKSIESFHTLDKRDSNQLIKQGIDSVKIWNQKVLIEKEAYELLFGTLSISGVQSYIDNYKYSPLRERAVFVRDSLAFELASREHSSGGYQLFMKKYPDSHLFNEAKTKYERTLFQEQTAEGTIDSYVNFIINFPNSPHHREAQRDIFELFTDNSNDPDVYYQFIKKFPGSPFKDEAWQRVYDLYMMDYDENAVAKFKVSYPEYPFQDQLLVDFKLSKEEYLPYRYGKLWGFINSSGAIVIEAGYDFVEHFYEGLAIVARGGKMGYINKSGEEVIAPFFDEAENFHNNYAVVGENGKFGIVNRNGRMVVPLSYSDIGDMNEGYSVFFNDSTCGYLSRSGTEVIKPVYNSCGDFNFNTAICELDGYYGLIDESGNEVIPMKFDAVISIDDKLVKVQLNDKWGIYRTDGTVLAGFEYDEIGDMHDNRVMVVLNGKLGYINHKGEFVVQPVYDSFAGYVKRSEFREKLAVVEYRGLMGLIDTMGNKVIPFKYNDVIIVDRNIAGVKKNNKWGLIDLVSGKQIMPFRFESVTPFDSGYAIVKLKGKMGLIDKNGYEVLDPVYDQLEYAGFGFYIASDGNKSGLINKKNEVILPFEFVKFSNYKNHYLRYDNKISQGWFDLQIGKSIFYLNSNDSPLIK